MSFSDLGLSPETLKAVEEVGYSTPTPIQEQAIPYVLMGRDVLGIAQTGTGKTASFTLPMIDILAQGRAKALMPRSLILAPTRELAHQVAENFTLYGKYHKLSMALLIGGESFTEQERALSRGVDVLIATPGRLMDLFDRGRILMSDVKILVIDEADRMLDMGFIPDVERIVSMLPPLRQTLFFSATMDTPIRKLADAFLSNPKEVRVAPKQQTASTVTQTLLVVDEYDKREALRQILREEEVRNAFIFCNRKRDVGILYRSLKKHGFDVGQLHGDMSQPERTATLAQFKAGDVRLLVCSDVAARGIDIADVSHVFNFDVPGHSEDYVHRIGRTGRAGREGRAFTLATPEDTKAIAAVEKLIGNAIPRLDLDGIETQELSEEAAKAARKSRRSGDRRRKEKPKRHSQPAETSSEAPTEAQSDSPAESKDDARTESRSDTRDNGRTENSRQENGRQENGRQENGRQDSSRGDAGRSNARRDRNRGGRRNHPAWEVEEMEHGDDVVAFGDHVPSFMKVDVSQFAGEEEDLLSDEDADRLEDEIIQVNDDIEDVDSPDDTPDDETPSRSRVRRRRRNRGRDRSDNDEGATESNGDEGTDGEGADGAGDETDRPAKTRRRRSARRRKAETKVAEPAEGNDDSVAEESAPTVAEAPTDAAESAEQNAGPDDSQAEQGQADGGEADESAVEAVTEKPKRTVRRRKTTKAAEDKASEEAASGETAAQATGDDGTPAETLTEAPQADAQADAQAEATTDAPDAADGEAVTEKPKRTRKPAAKKTTTTRTRKKATPAAASAADAVEGDAVTDAPADAADGEAVTEKPKRTRKPAVKKATTTRTRKKATPAEGEATSDAPVDGEEVTEKPKRTRAPRKKKVEAPAPDDAPAEAVSDAPVPAEEATTAPEPESNT